MGSDVGDVSDRGLIELDHIGLPMQVTRRGQFRLATWRPGAAPITPLLVRTSTLGQLPSMISAMLFQIAHVLRQLEVLHRV